MLNKNMSFNNIKKPNIYLLEGRRKSPFFPLQREIVSFTRGHRLRKTKKGLLEISQPIGFIVANDEDAVSMIENLTSWLITDDWAPLTFDDEPGRYYRAVLDNDMADFEKFVRQRKGTLQFIAISCEGEPKNINLITSNQTFTVGGQESTPWTSRTRFTVPQSSFSLESSVGKVILKYDFIAGDVLEIDYRKRDVFLNGKDLAVSVQLETEWFALPVGNVQLKSSQPTEVKYSERYY